MKPYAVPLSLLGAALILAGGLAYVLAEEPGVGILINVVVGLALVVVVGVLNPELFRHYGRWLNAAWGAVMVLGIIVDDAIVVGESIYARRENGDEAFTAVLEGTREVFWPVMTAVLTSIVAFMPLLFVSSMIGKFIAVMPGPIIAALIISMFEALIILPVHLRHLPRPRNGETRSVPLYNLIGQLRRFTGFGLRFMIQRIYCPLLKVLLRWRYATFASGLVVIGEMVPGYKQLYRFESMGRNCVRMPAR